MILTCADLPAFHAGELDDVRAEAMRRHIGGCKHCGQELQQLILEEIVTHPMGRPLPPARQSPKAVAFLQERLKIRPGLFVGVSAAVGLLKRRVTRRRGSLTGLALGTLSAAAAVFLVSHPTPPPEPARIDSLASFLAPSRSAEMRISGADTYRPYDVKRASSPIGEDLSHGLLGELQRRGEFRSLFAALMLRGELNAAARELEKSPPGADRESDRAALALANDRPDAALGHAAEALAQAPELGRALWNAALARRRLQLPLGAAALFDRVASLGEPGWADEARSEASRLRATRTAQLERSRLARTEADRLARDRTPMSLDLARGYPDVAREALFKALCGASPAEAALLVPLADAVDQEQATSSLGAQARAAARATRGRPELAAEYARLATAAPQDAAAWLALTRRARGARVLDIELGALFRAAEGGANVVAELNAAARASKDRWLQSWAAREQAWYLLYTQRTFAAAEPVLVQAIEDCPDAGTCAMLKAFLAVTMAAQGRYDLARTHIEQARAVAAAAQNDKLDLRLLHLATEIAVVRDPDAADPVALAAAFSEEYWLQEPGCTYELRHLDYLALAALDMNRPADARRFSDQAEAVRRERCQSEEPRLNGSMARARLLQHQASDDEIARLRADATRLRTVNETIGGKALADHIEGRVLIERNREEAEALLRRAIAAGAQAPGEGMASDASQTSFVLLAMDAGRRGDFRSAFDRMVEAEGRPAASCTLGVAGEDGAAVVVAMDREGEIHGSYRPRPTRAGSRMPSVEELVPERLAATLVPCDVVDVLARGAYYGRARLLPRHLAWRYRSPAAGSGREAVAGSRLVVTGVEPPVRLGLPALRDEANEAGAIVVRGGAATPRRVLARMADAAVIEIHAHGLVDAKEPSSASLALSPDADGDYALTADRVRGATLARHPLVLLAACDAARTLHSGSRWGLADAFLAAGARSVVASTSAMPDSGLSATLSAVTDGVRTGRSAAAAVRDVRLAHPDRDWLNDIVVFE
jgi:hypothetical protein